MHHVLCSDLKVYQMLTLLCHMEISKRLSPCWELSPKWNLPHLSNSCFCGQFLKLDFLSLFHTYFQSTHSLIQVMRNGKFFYAEVHFILVLLYNLWIIVGGTGLPSHRLKVWLMSYSALAKLALSVVVSTILICYLSYFLTPDLEGCSQLLICIGVRPVLPMEIQPTKILFCLGWFVSSRYIKSFYRRPKLCGCLHIDSFTSKISMHRINLVISIIYVEERNS